MKRLLYFDPFNGISGDMILGALIDLGLPLQHLENELTKIDLGGIDLSARRIGRQGLFGIDFRVEGTPAQSSHGHQASHDHSLPNHPHHDHQHGDHSARGFLEIKTLIEDSGLEAGIKTRSIEIFRRLGDAEAKVHGSTLDSVHFHEVGAIDSIVDIVGACIGFAYLGIDEFFAAPVCLGFGTVRFSHGLWPVPAPATAELLRGLPAYPGPVEAEMTTPTGAAILSQLAQPLQGLEAFRILRSGFGAGDREFDQTPNMLRLILGESDAPPDGDSEDVIALEANLDDMEPRLAGHFIELALAQGALDAFYIPATMKKSRPGLLLTVLCRSADQVRFADLILRETPSLGVRWKRQRRRVLRREIREVETPYGTLKVKVGFSGDQIVNAVPEFEDLQRAAREGGIPLKDILQGFDWRTAALCAEPANPKEN